MKRNPHAPPRPPGLAERIGEIFFWMAHTAGILVVLGIAGLLLAAVVTAFGR